MTYTIIIILVAFLIVCGIAGTAIQQNNERKANAKREEVNRQRSIYEETEESIVAALQMPVSQLLIGVLRTRSLNCLKAINEYSPSLDLYNKIEDIKKTIAGINTTEAAPDQNTFILPKTDKVIIKYIQAVKKLRGILRSEHSKGNIPSAFFVQEETALANLQLRVNIETLMKRATDAVENKMQGSARQYIEKAITALGNYKTQTEYTIERTADFEAMRDGLEMNVKDNNLKQILEEKEKENKEIDSLFAPKKKW
jgi:uncharacterized Zn finger protein (UPF0148 family)